jgi:ubiquinol-cytochrome c reductase cytochrome b subunit
MRDVPWGWLIRYMHSTGASAFFVVVYLHMFRGLIYGSYRKPRELVWIFGCAIFLCLMAEAFMGYLLPWGPDELLGRPGHRQPVCRRALRRPGPGADDPRRLRRRRRDAEPLLQFPRHRRAAGAAGPGGRHLLALHDVGSNNPDGVEIKKGPKDASGKPLDGIAFHPFYTVHDIYGVCLFLMVFTGHPVLRAGAGRLLSWSTTTSSRPTR